ncbi:unnamed protein product [Absidia cylindrospora]
MTSPYTLPSLYEIVKPDFYTSSFNGGHSSAFHRVGSPPELLHDSEEDDNDSLSTLPSLHQQQQQQHAFNYDHPRRKSIPHKSPSVIQDAFQASALDKSVVFQWNTATITDMSPQQQEYHHHHTQQQQPMVVDQHHVQSKVICGESLLSALRHRVALARQQDLPIKKRAIHMRRRQLVATCIALPTHHKQQITKHKMSIPLLVSPPLTTTNSHPMSSPLPQPELISYYEHPPSPMSTPPPSSSPSPILSPAPSLPSVLPTSTSALSPSSPSSTSSLNLPISSAAVAAPISPITTTTTNTHQSKQRGRKPLQHTRHASSGRPSRVKGPCQACHETSDGCMRKAFDWPFPASQIFNDKGKPFVYLCNKCGLRYNKSGGCVCRHCRWVFCKEEKRKAMQYIDKMRRNRPDGHVDLDEDIENFVCSPKYWSCGRPWKVGWVLNGKNNNININNNNNQASDDDDDNDSSSSFPSL